MFKFDFQVEDIEKENPFTKNLETKTDKKTLNDKFSIEWYQNEKIIPSKDITDNLDVCKLNSTQKIVNNIKIIHMISGFLLEDIKDHASKDLDLKKAEDQDSDLIPGVYEGGAKIWECTEDLLQYLAKQFPASEWTSMRVLDLGCGCGILGIYAFLNGAKVTFQDYNKDVLEKITIPNVFLNSIRLNENNEEEEMYDVEKIDENVQFYSGDWDKWRKSTKTDEQFDIILTSETIYNPENQLKLLNCLHDKLKTDGKVYVAAKTYYFGVGGGLRQFEQLIEHDERFKCKVVWHSSEGLNREIVELTKTTK